MQWRQKAKMLENEESLKVFSNKYANRSFIIILF